MTRDVAESAVGVGPMTTLMEHRRVDARHGARVMTETWRRTRLRWADPTSRSLMMTALTFGSLLVACGITFFLQVPPALDAMSALLTLAIVLLTLACIVAPAMWWYRWIALWLVMLCSVCTAAWIALCCTDLLGPATYGAVDALDFLAFGSALLAFLVLRMRHPLVILFSAICYTLLGGLLFTRVVPAVRAQVPATTYTQVAPADELVIRASLVGIAAGIVILAWWLDSWCRGFIPVHGTARAPDATTPAVRDDLGRIRIGWIMIAAGLDGIAVVLAHRAKKPSPRGRLDAADDWMATAVLSIAYARMTLVWLFAGALAIWFLNPGWRP